MLQTFRGVRPVEEGVGEGKFGHAAGAGMYPLGDIAEHLLGDVEPPEFGLRLPLVEDAGEAAFAAADVEDAAPGEIAEVISNQFDVVNAGVDRGREMLLIGGGFVERGLDAGA